MSVEPPRAVGTGLVQDVTLSDGESTINLSVWDDNTNKFEALQVYKFTNLYTCSHLGIKSLTYSRRSDYEVRSNDTTPIEIRDIEVQEETDVLTNALVIGVIKFNLYLSCLNCNGVLPYSETHTARCSLCSMLQLVQGRDYIVSADIVAQIPFEKKILNLCNETMLNLLKAEIPSQEIEQQLLNLPEVDITYTKRNNVIKNVEHSVVL
uniref:Uncharacterized protein n=1 Tax=Amphimedon queenslandica TaxID=400682 RepID=A0A1X7TFR2_AMPQE